MANYKTEWIDELAQQLLEKGFRVFVAESGTYGLYTNEEGSRVVSFAADLGGITASGNYRSKHSGTGWGITKNFNIDEAQSYLDSAPPYWAARDEVVKPTSLDQHMELYQSSSRYIERKLLETGE